MNLFHRAHNFPPRNLPPIASKSLQIQLSINYGYDYRIECTFNESACQDFVTRTKFLELKQFIMENAGLLKKP